MGPPLPLVYYLSYFILCIPTLLSLRLTYFLNLRAEKKWLYYYGTEGIVIWTPQCKNPGFTTGVRDSVDCFAYSRYSYVVLNLVIRVQVWDESLWPRFDQLLCTFSVFLCGLDHWQTHVQIGEGLSPYTKHFFEFFLFWKWLKILKFIFSPLWINVVED